MRVPWQHSHEETESPGKANRNSSRESQSFRTSRTEKLKTGPAETLNHKLGKPHTRLASRRLVEAICFPSLSHPSDGVAGKSSTHKINNPACKLQAQTEKFADAGAASPEFPRV